MRLALVAVLVATASVVACSSGGSSAPRTATKPAQVSVEATATAEPAPTPVDELDDVRRLTLDEPLEIGPGPDQLNVTLYLEQGCTGCDGPPTAIERVYRDESGSLQREKVFSAPEGAHYMTTTAVAPDGRLFATACFGDCAEVGNFLREGSSAFFVSTDNGATWARTDYPGESLKVVTLLPGGQPVVRVALAGATEAESRFEMWPLSNNLEAPGPKFWPIGTQDRFHPLVWENWETGERIFQDGSSVGIPARGGAGAEGVPRLVGTQPPGEWLVNWSEPGSGAIRQRLLASTYAGDVRWDYRVPAEVGVVIPSVWLDETRAIAWTNYSTPALVDFDAGTLREIVIGKPLDQAGGRNKPIGIAPKP